MPPKKRELEEGGGGGAGEGGAGGSGGGTPSLAPVLKKRCRSFDLEIRGCRHLQEFAAAVKISLEAALESAVARIHNSKPARSLATATGKMIDMLHENFDRSCTDIPNEATTLLVGSTQDRIGAKARAKLVASLLGFREAARMIA